MTTAPALDCVRPVFAAFDSEVLGMCVGHLGMDHIAGIRAGSPVVVVSEDAPDGFDYILAKIPGTEFAAAHALEDQGFRTLGQALDFRFVAGQPIPIVGEEVTHPSGRLATVRAARPEDAEEVGRIAEATFTVDRIDSDPALGRRRASSFYGRWASNVCLGKYANGMFVAELDGRTVGFLSWAELTGKELGIGTHARLDLLGVDPAYKGYGIAKRLVLHSMEHLMMDRAYPFMEGGTDATNLRPLNLYPHFGWSFVRTWNVMRWAREGLSC